MQIAAAMEKGMGKDRTVAIIQARLGSSRLPLKSLLSLEGKPVIEWVLDRVKKARLIDQAVVAIPDTELDGILKNHLLEKGIHCISGSENDVLDRMVNAARQTEASQIVRICADNPLIDPESIDELVEFYRETSPDYAYNHVPKNNLWPDGLGAEIISRELLEEIHAKANLPSQREHCLNYIWDNSTQFRIRTFDPKNPVLRRPEIKLDLDSVADYQRLCALSPSPRMTAEEIVEAWDKNKQKQIQINKGKLS